MLEGNLLHEVIERTLVDNPSSPDEAAETAVELFESLPKEFTFDELVDAGQDLGHSAERVAEYFGGV